MRYHCSPRRLQSTNNVEDYLAQTIAGRIQGRAQNITREIKEHPNFSKPIAVITASSILGGMRGLPLIPWPVSSVDPEKGIMYRRKSLPEVIAHLPKSDRHQFPSVERVFHLLLAGADDMSVARSDSLALPLSEDSTCDEEKDLAMISKALDCCDVDDDLIIRSCRAVDLSRDAHPMTQFIQGLIGAQNSSILAETYSPEIEAATIASSTLIDGAKLLQFLPILVGYIYRRSTHDTLSPTRYLQVVKEIQEKNPSLDWCGHLVRYMGLVDDGSDSHIILCYEDLMRLFIMSHADHEGGNVSAHISHITSSAHADIFYAYLAGMCGLAGPLHGMANQQSLAWQRRTFNKIMRGSSIRSEEDLISSPPIDWVADADSIRDQIRNYVRDELNSGGKIAGFGHAVLRVTDPRYQLFRDFGQKLLDEDSSKSVMNREASDLIHFNHMLADVVPALMKDEFPKIQSPWPNVDLGSGVVLMAMGVKEPTTYTMLFGLSRALGIIAAAVWSRSLKLPIERPKSITLGALLDSMRQRKPNDGKSSDTLRGSEFF